MKELFFSILFLVIEVGFILFLALKGVLGAIDLKLGIVLFILIGKNVFVLCTALNKRKKGE